MAKITVDRTACIRCGSCVDVCVLAHVFALDEEGSQAIASERCWGCGQCVATCPTDAIDHDGFPLEQCPIIEPEAVPTIDQLTTAFRARRSQRVYTDQPVPREIIRELVSLGRWGPSAQNSQSLDWLAFDDPARITELSKGTVEEMARFARLADNPVASPFVRLIAGKDTAEQLKGSKRFVQRMTKAIAGGSDPIFYHAPVVLVAHTTAGNRFGRDDAVYAGYNIMLAAERQGLGSCQIGFFQAVIERSSRFRKRLGLPDTRRPQYALALGYPRRSFRRMIPRRTPDLTWNPR